jgi:hypothetical protein
MTIGRHTYKLDHLPRVSISFFIIVSYVAVIILGGFFPDFINTANKELLVRLGDAFYLSIAFYFSREGLKSIQKNDDENRSSKDGV